MNQIPDEPSKHTTQSYDLRKVRKSLERGELISMIAKVNSGIIDPDMFEQALEAHSKKLWPSLLFRVMFEK